MSTVPALQPAAHDLRARVAGLIFWVILPIVAVSFVVAAGFTFAHRVNAQPGGVSGTYAVTLRSCFGSVCLPAGTFTSDDKKLVVPNVVGDSRWKIGEQHRVVLNPDSEIIALPAKWNPTATIVGAFGGIVFLGVWLYCLFGSLHRRRVAGSAP